MLQAGTVRRDRKAKEQYDEKKVDWKENIEGQSRITYTGAAQSLHGAKVERGGRTDEKKIEEKERKHTVKPSEDKNERDSRDSHELQRFPFLCKAGEKGQQRGI